jgi:hypothetical protein
MAKATENVRISAIGTITEIAFLFMVSAPFYWV